MAMNLKQGLSNVKGMVAAEYRALAERPTPKREAETTAWSGKNRQHQRGPVLGGLRTAKGNKGDKNERNKDRIGIGRWCHAWHVHLWRD